MAIRGRICPTVANLPDGWQVQGLAHICTKIGTGATPRGGREVYLGSRVSHALVRSQNVFDRHFDRDGLAFISNQNAMELRNAEIQSGDVLLNITGDGVTFGRACIIPDDILPACVNQHVSIIRPDRRECDPGYLLSLLTHPASKDYIESFNAGGSRRAITKGHIESFQIPLPPLPEQKRIAHILGTLDDKIELNRRMNQTLEAMARALFQSWFVDFDPVRAKQQGCQPAGMDAAIAALFPSKFEDSELGTIPKGWKVESLSRLCELGRGSSPRPINDYMNGEVPWVKIADATAAGGPFLFETKEKVTRAGSEMSVAVAPGDLILSNSATCGIPMFIELHGCIHDGWLYFKHLRSISKHYLFHVLIELAGHLVQIADGSVQKNLNINLVGQQHVLIPPKAVMDAFDAHAIGLFAKMRMNGVEARTLATLRDVLLPMLLSGENVFSLQEAV